MPTGDPTYPQRHIKQDSSRGVDYLASKESLDLEDAACMAGMRNPAEVVRKWPSLATAMAPLRRVLGLATPTNEELQDLPLACGEKPSKPPPSLAAIAWARELASKELGLTREEGEAHHAAGKWRHRIVGAVQRRCDCPDTVLETWLGPRGAPMGIASEITPGGLFPHCHSPAEAEVLDANFWTKGNHPSFGLSPDEETGPPGLDMLAGYFEKGYAESYTTIAEAEQIHCKLILSPTGTLSKFKAGRLTEAQDHPGS